MKLITSLALIFMCTITFAQEPKELNVGEFSTVKVYDLIHISLIKSTENKVIISGDDIQDVNIVNTGGTLKIKMAFDKIFNGSNTFVAVHYTQLKSIDGNEGAYIVGNTLIVQDKIELRAQEGAKLKIGLDVKEVSIRAVSGGRIKTNGKADTQTVSLNTGGIYEGEGFPTKNTTVTVRAGGEADVNASESVDAKVTAGGDVYIYGNPLQVNKKTTFGGDITVRKGDVNTD
ncbi:DUF2807 domain-containing protein [Bizionia gelidisalsuginis]|uniref:DUF2807 domain-containing protein n=2 Tax=Bizionia TaxID=283785 RepID=A0A8H2QJ92_9FLAO|nr:MULTISPECIES: head GIN domain-containing protein [Bizionia]TYB74161.1 DUF2807 domain-containing protein [Bizionia saleffrena]TYC15616.1 DUF2807 domain-containing protein [Bizionia gelidisalsuginis]